MKEGREGSCGGVGRRSSQAPAGMGQHLQLCWAFLQWQPLSSLPSSSEAPQTWWSEACPTLWLPPTSPEAAAAPQPFLVSSLSLRHTELCLCLGSSRSYSAMQRTCALEKNLDKKSHPMTFFSSVCSNKKSTCSAWSPQLLMSTLPLTLNWVYTALFLYICFKAEQTNFTYVTSKQLFTFLEAVWRQ